MASITGLSHVQSQLLVRVQSTAELWGLQRSEAEEMKEA